MLAKIFGYKWIFVVGCGHSGTSLVAAMLGAHPRIYAIPFETYAFTKAGDPKSLLKEIARSCDKRAARYICEKTPIHVTHIPDILKTFPRSHIVVCLREPKDVCASLKRRHGDLEKGVTRWLHDNQCALESMETPNILPLRYEQLIQDTEPTLERLCRALSLKYSPSMLDFWKDERDWFGNVDRKEHEKHRNWQIHQPLMTNRISVYRAELSDDEIAYIDEKTKTLAQALGVFEPAR